MSYKISSFSDASILENILFVLQVQCAQLGSGDDPATKQLTENLEKMQNRLKTLDLGDSLEVPFDSNFLSVEQYGYNEAHPRGRFIRANRYYMYSIVCIYAYMFLYLYLSILHIKYYKMMELYVIYVHIYKEIEMVMLYKTTHTPNERISKTII